MKYDHFEPNVKDHLTDHIYTTFILQTLRDITYRAERLWSRAE